MRDTGIGIPADRLHTLFQAFTQVDTSTTRRFGGTGLGLSIVKRLTEMMGGEVGVESRDGQGSAFWFTASLGSAPAATPDLPAEPGFPGVRALVVDDNQTSLEVVGEQLERLGLRTMRASTAVAALSFLQAAAAPVKPIDVALLDEQMPDGGGAELGLRIRADERLQATRLILLVNPARQRAAVPRHLGIQRLPGEASGAARPRRVPTGCAGLTV